MFTLLPTARYFDQLIARTESWTRPGIATIPPGTITPASQLWVDFAFLPVRFVLDTLTRLESETGGVGDGERGRYGDAERGGLAENSEPGNPNSGLFEDGEVVEGSDMVGLGDEEISTPNLELPIPDSQETGGLWETENPIVGCVTSSTTEAHPATDSTAASGTPEAHPCVARYQSLKAQYPDTIVFVRVGDFAETYFDDAKTLCQQLDFILTTKRSGNQRIPMTGIPTHAFKRYEAQLTAIGYTVRYDNPDDDKSSEFGVRNSECGVERKSPTEGDSSLSASPPPPSNKPPRSNIEPFEIIVDGIPIAVSYDATWSRHSHTVHFEFRSTLTPPRPIPCSQSGYLSHFSTREAVAGYSSPQAYAQAYVEANHIPRLKNPTQAGAVTQEDGTQMALTLDFNPPAEADEADLDATALAKTEKTDDAPIPAINLPRFAGNLAEVSKRLPANHELSRTIGKRGKILKIDDDIEGNATLELLDGERITLSTLYLERVTTPEITYLSQHVGYATLDGKLQAWVGFKTKDLYQAWCCRSRSHSPRIKGIGEARRSTHLLQHKWECPVKNPTLKQLQALAQNDFSKTPPVTYTSVNLPKIPPLVRPILEPGTRVKITAECGVGNLTGKIGTVTSDYLKNGFVNGIMVKVGQVEQYLTDGEFQVLEDEKAWSLVA